VNRSHGVDALPDSYLCGFAIPEAALPFDGPETVTDVAGPTLA
jgi:hypothetical protein